MQHPNFERAYDAYRRRGGTDERDLFAYQLASSPEGMRVLESAYPPFIRRENPAPWALPARP